MVNSTDITTASTTGDIGTTSSSNASTTINSTSNFNRNSSNSSSDATTGLSTNTTSNPPPLSRENTDSVSQTGQETAHHPSSAATTRISSLASQQNQDKRYLYQCYSKHAKILNSILSHYNLPHKLTSPSQLTSPSLYIICLEHLTQKRIEGIIRKPSSEVDHLANMERVLRYLGEITGRELTLDAREIREGNLESIQDLVKRIETVRNVVWGRLLKERMMMQKRRVVKITQNSSEEASSATTTTTTTTTTSSSRIVSSSASDQKRKQISALETAGEDSSPTIEKSNEQIITSDTHRGTNADGIQSQLNSTTATTTVSVGDERMYPSSKTRPSAHLSKDSLLSSEHQPSILNEHSLDTTTDSAQRNDEHSLRHSILKEEDVISSEDDSHRGRHSILREEDKYSSDTDSVSSDASTTVGEEEEQRLKERQLKQEQQQQQRESQKKSSFHEEISEPSHADHPHPARSTQNIFGVEIHNKKRPADTTTSNASTTLDQENIDPSEGIQSFEPPQLKRKKSTNTNKGKKRILNSRPSSAPLRSSSTKRRKRRSKRKKSSKRRSSSTSRSRAAGGLQDMYQPFVDKFQKSGRPGLATLLELQDMKRRAHCMQRDQKIENIRLRKWNEKQQQDFKANIYKRRVYEENMMRAIYKEMMKIEKERVIMEGALEKQQATLFENALNQKHTSQNNYYRDQMALMKEIMHKQRQDRLTAKKAQTKALKKLSREARARNWNKMNAKRLKHVVSEQAKYVNEMSSDAMADRIMKQFMR